MEFSSPSSDLCLQDFSPRDTCHNHASTASAISGKRLASPSLFSGPDLTGGKHYPLAIEIGEEALESGMDRGI